MIVVMVRVGNLISLSQQFYVGKWSYGPFAPQPNDTHKSRVFRMRLTDKTKMQKKNSKKYSIWKPNNRIENVDSLRKGDG